MLVFEFQVCSDYVLARNELRRSRAGVDFRAAFELEEVLSRVCFGEECHIYLLRVAVREDREDITACCFAFLDRSHCNRAGCALRHSYGRRLRVGAGIIAVAVADTQR